MKAYSTFIILTLGLAIRLILFIINDEYNDDHITPVLEWIKNGEYPGTFDCWECFQPPLFYWLVKQLSLLFGISDFKQILLVIRSLNFFFSVCVLIVIIFYISKIEISSRVKLPIMLFWTLNPELISIGALNTNDILLILLGCMCYVLIIRYYILRSSKYEYFIALIVFLLGITKGNGLVYLPIFGLIWLILFFNRAFQYSDYIRSFLLFTITVVLVCTIGGYYSKFEKYNDPFIINIPKSDSPNFFEPDEEYKGRKGVTSLTQSFFTFRIINLINEPYNRNGWKDYPIHRTSYFTQLYGQFCNYFFENHPESWHSANNDLRNFVIVNYILHLPIFILFLFECIKRSIKLVKFKIQLPEIQVLILILFLIFSIRYSFMYRDFSSMKLIFFYPAILPMISISTTACEKKMFTSTIAVILYIISMLYIITFLYLIKALTI